MTAHTTSSDPSANAGERHRGPVAIVGAGSIGIAFALVFAAAGRQVRVYDVSAEFLASGPQRLADRLRFLSDYDLVEEAADAILERVTFLVSLADTVAGAPLVIECTPEVLEIKRAVFAELADLVDADAAVASSSSAILASEFAGDLSWRDRCLVIHPANPPYLIRVIEVVPAAFTSPEIVERVERILGDSGMEVVRVRRELTGFVYNRLQGALLREAYCLVRDGVVDVEGIDAIVRDGLGLRWSVIGPFETVDLNTRGGIEAHAARLGPAYERMGAERGQHDPWTPELVADVTAQRRALLPLEDWEERGLWRDRRLAGIQQWRRRQDAEESSAPDAGEIGKKK